MRVEDLFPVCSDRKCPDIGQHKHVLPAQRDLIHAREKYICSVGGYGSGKSLAAAIHVVLSCLTIPGNLWFVGRRSYPKLHDSTLTTYLGVLQRSGIEWVGRENRDGFPHRIIFPGNESQIVFRETQDLGRFLGPEYGGFHLDEAKEEPEESFTGLMGRLRLPRAGHALKGILTTNPPDKTHWIAAWFGTAPGVMELEREGVLTLFRLIKSSTRENKHLPEGYLEGLLGLKPSEVKRIVEGEFGFTPEGPAVYSAFKPEVHVGVPGIRPVPLVRGWDFGYRHPAVSFMQVWRCDRQRPHISLLHEFDAKEIETEKFADLVLDETKRVFHQVSPRMIVDCGDAAGAALSERGPGPIPRLGKPPYNLRFRYTKMKSIDPSLEFIRKVLRMPVCPCGQPVLVVHRNNRNTIEGFSGGYHYPRTNRDKPVKDGHYDDVMDAVRYGIWNYVRLEFLDPGMLERLGAAPRTPANTPGTPWDWMERRIS